MILPPLYHWSPVERRKQIHRHGLRPGCRVTTCTTKAVLDGHPMVCLAATPEQAWKLSGWYAARNGRPGTSWDLWQVQIADGDEVHVLAFFGPAVHEVRVGNRIPKSRLWWIATRGGDGALPPAQHPDRPRIAPGCGYGFTV